jgi:hypothetical protein
MAQVKVKFANLPHKTRKPVIHGVLTFIQLANGKREKAEKYLQSVAAKRGMDLARFPDGFLEAEEQHIVETRKKNASDVVTWKEIARYYTIFGPHIKT